MQFESAYNLTLSGLANHLKSLTSHPGQLILLPYMGWESAKVR